MATPKQSRSLIVISNSDCNNLSIHRQPKHEVFMGNLNHEMSTRTLINSMQQLFISANVRVPDFRFTIFQRKSKKNPPQKYAFVTLANKTEEELVYQFDNKEDLNFVNEGMKLQVKKRFNFRPKISKNIKMLFNGTGNKLKRSQSAPGIPSDDDSQENVNNNTVYRKEMYIGQFLPVEDRVTEYKRGSGKYMKNMLINHIRKYICAFLNSKGGRLMIGVDDNCKVYGVSCNRKQEDQARCLIDNTIKNFQPHVAPHLYVIDFIPVKISPYDDIELDSIDPLLKVVEVSVKRPNIINSLYLNDHNEIFIRRDGSVEGPLKTAQIVEWCRLIFASTYGNKNNLDGIDEDIILAKESFTNSLNIDRLEVNIMNALSKLEDQIKTQNDVFNRRERILMKEIERSRNEPLSPKISVNKPSATGTLWTISVIVGFSIFILYNAWKILT